ncbi:hypothetical protein Tco_0497479 [Tanacetum coccineum]
MVSESAARWCETLYRGRKKRGKKEMGKKMREMGGGIRRFEIIKYSFRQDEEYVAIKEDEYDDLARTSEDACRAYQEIFRMMDKGWMVTRDE